MCDDDDNCTGFVLPAYANQNWCETYTSSKATGDGRNFFCYMKKAHVAPTPSADGYTYSKGACRGGARPQMNAGLKFHRDRNCEARCNADKTCSGFVMPMTASNWCETYTSPGVKGDGRNFHCFSKKGFTAPPTPKPTLPPAMKPMGGYIFSLGACRGGQRPQANAGLKLYRDRGCQKRCDEDKACTAFVLPNNAGNWCETYTSPGAKGDGRNFLCYSKPTGPTPAPVPTPKPTVQQFEGYEYSKGACRGGGAPAANAGLKFYRDGKCMDRCNNDDMCTGFVLPVFGAAWCETYTSPNAQGDGRNFRCYMKREGYEPYEDYVYSKGACRGGKMPQANAGLKFYRDGNCKKRCDDDDLCTGFVLPAAGAAWCETYKSIGAKGDGRNFRCFMKKDYPAPPTPAPVPTPKPTFQQFEGYVFSYGACRGGETPERNAGLKLYYDGNCKQRCDQHPTCTGFVLPLGEPSWCETYTSPGAKGDGRAYRCYMKEDFDSSDTDPPTPAPVGEPDECKEILKKRDCLTEEACLWEKEKSICYEKPEIEEFDGFLEFVQYCESLEGEMDACEACQGKMKSKKGKMKCKLPSGKKLKCKKVKDMEFCMRLGCGATKGNKKCIDKAENIMK